MIEIIQSEAFEHWIRNLVDRTAVARINARIRRLSIGNAGDVRPVGNGISELRIHYGPGYRVYFLQQGNRIAVLLCGGDKSTQTKDIKAAKQMAAIWKE
ncbi:MAG: type II toxin-antitoxin system RelE/ParE family toxin [Spongiibacteraceae bacterium]